MTAAELLDQMLVYARRVAFRMSKDPEMESIANYATLRAARTYDVTKGVPIGRWVAVCVRRDVYGHWRKAKKRREVHKDRIWWRECVVARETRLTISDDDREFLTRYYIDKWPLDVMAREYKTTVYYIRKRIEACVSRLKRETDDA